MHIATDEKGLGGLRGGVVVPTMGALHDGHAALIRRAVEVAGGERPVVVTIFVNPTQFNEPADFERYPRTFDADVAMCTRAGADAVFAPSVDEVYPSGDRRAAPTLPEQATAPGLEDRFRPGHFKGVCEVVRRLFELTGASAAVFGEKDWQQLQVIRAMTARDGLGVAITPCPTVREPDGLAMSSRNRFLSAGERASAAAVSRALCEACGKATAGEAERVMREVLEAEGLEAEYAVAREAESLRAREPGWRGPGRALIAARLGTVRLIDNAPWPI